MPQALITSWTLVDLQFNFITVKNIA
jgi:hypothetical protein